MCLSRYGNGELRCYNKRRQFADRLGLSLPLQEKKRTQETDRAADGKWELRRAKVLAVMPRLFNEIGGKEMLNTVHKIAQPKIQLLIIRVASEMRMSVPCPYIECSLHKTDAECADRGVKIDKTCDQEANYNIYKYSDGAQHTKQKLLVFWRPKQEIATEKN